MAALDPASLDFAAMEPVEFARLIKQTSRQELEAAMSGPLRRDILDEVFARMAGRLRPERAGSLRAVLRWHVTAADGAGDTYDLAVADGACTVRAASHGDAAPDGDDEPRVTLTVDPVSFLKLVSGNASGPGLFMTRKLRLAGDLALGASLTSFFDIPKA
ncbi:MAG: SCP2 sterol-binding domain-containing protein [Actinocatenispora sp.]